MADLTVYEKPTCTTCRNLATLLQERGIDFDRVDYHVEGLTEPELRGLLKLAGATAHEFLRARDWTAVVPGQDVPDNEDELIALMVLHPQLVQRPIVVRGDRAVLARPVERVLELLD